ncbi:hypothetical protein SAMN03159293_03274 [Pseudomonas sp. NFACC39-1]|nr:hypothetical protein SAMN03159293_03274 [Pseudomonas sp. NFACC39-1]SFG93657.1 hypothetical protein SAMN03159297_02073 [Pseudomonas sp. NFACC45]
MFAPIGTAFRAGANLLDGNSVLPPLHDRHAEPILLVDEDSNIGHSIGV